MSTHTQEPIISHVAIHRCEIIGSSVLLTRLIPLHNSLVVLVDKVEVGFISVIVCDDTIEIRDPMSKSRFKKKNPKFEKKKKNLLI